MNLKHAIIKTISFFDLFDFPLTAEEIKEYLYQWDRPTHIKEVKGTLKEMETVEKVHDYYVLKGRGTLVDTRKSRHFRAEKYWNRVRQYGQYIAHVPFVRMIAVCNNLAYNNPTDTSDIDLFIVIEKGRMWIARLWISLILQFFGVRRHGDKITGRFCLSFFVTPAKMDMEPLLLKPEDPYLAYWTKLLMPFYGKETYEQFKTDNEKWLKEKYGLNLSDDEKIKFSFQQKSHWKNFWELVLKGWFGNWMERLLKKTFKKRTLRKAKALGPEASVVVTDDMLKFHNKDRRKEYFEKWKKAV